ncbi:MAG: phosphoribosylanthranilate isomerase [Leptolyngbya sp. SIO1D8]|nr:phosphoribosylanthranilate isomerase [Leptolyngbya sp. SIO1D8]
MNSALWVKICGLMQPQQAVEIAQLGADAIGFICVPASPRYVTPPQIQAISQVLAAACLDTVERVGVFANASLATLTETIEIGQLTALQLHGQESPATCARVRNAHPDLKLIKAFRIRSEADLLAVTAYEESVDRFLLDAYHPQQLGGTGQTIDWPLLKTFQPSKPWLLAGGLTPDNIQAALALLSPNGIDLSSGLEVSPGNKSLAKVEKLFQQLR